ncbi:MAG: Sir2 silent information regulator family NAD-dependent deacetylase [Clostridia bacterium]|nr:Sir2 silent information regulator family NAD-dependent deacetylase [Clostridia bacterium]
MDRRIENLRTGIQKADAVIIGAGAGLSTAAGYVYSGERFERYFADFRRKYGFQDMYSGGFYPYATPEEKWAFWSRNIWINRYSGIPNGTYGDLLRLVQGKDYFVLTTNVDHCFQRAGFDKARLFYTQGDYGLFQCSRPCCQTTWDNEAMVREMLLAQGFSIGEGGELIPPEGREPAMAIPGTLVPRCPNCGRPLTLNLRADDTFVEDEGWHRAAAAYEAWLAAHREGAVVYLEIGVGYNTPGIIKFSFWQQVYRNPRAVYACLNMEEDPVPEQIQDRSILLAGDAHRLIGELLA